MEKDELSKILNDVKKYKNEQRNILNNWQKLVSQAREAIFKYHCLKIDYLKECEPTYCNFRINKTCKYPEELSKFNKQITIK
jgi:hypothetical protein